MPWKPIVWPHWLWRFCNETIAIISKIANALFESRLRRFGVLPACAEEASTCILLKQLDIGLVYTKKSCMSAEAGEATGEDGQGDGVKLAIAAVEVGGHMRCQRRCPVKRRACGRRFWWRFPR
jgi:hypothetical protein